MAYRVSYMARGRDELDRITLARRVEREPDITERSTWEERLIDTFLELYDETPASIVISCEPLRSPGHARRPLRRRHPTERTA